MGGAWERMIRSVRHILSITFKDQVLTDNTLLTVMIEIESISNSRPLMPVTFNPMDNEPLIPNHLLLLRNTLTLTPGIFDKRDCYARRRWAQIQFLFDQFWRCWIREYWPTLQERQKWFQSVRNVTKDDIVLIVNDSQPRGKWCLGRILQTYLDKKGAVRSALIKTANSIVKRPITKLCQVIEPTSN